MKVISIILAVALLLFASTVASAYKLFQVGDTIYLVSSDIDRFIQVYDSVHDKQPQRELRKVKNCKVNTWIGNHLLKKDCSYQYK